ncbi:MAG: hypothetical protein P1Q69_01350, partial [Candidatus Thorarchaeota archaeon]|nr:hypothetical protein [Candidatus Thorarchaeota archaeon]
VELQVIRKDGSWIKGEEILNIFDKLVSNAKTLLDKRIRNSQVGSVREKYHHSTQTEEGERGSRVVATYKDPKGELKDFTLVGHDPNVTSLTWILEIATPPCTTLEELAWWVQTLIAISYDSLPKDANVTLIATGLNPAREYLKNLSFGEHHHFLGPEVSDKVKIGVFNLVRNFMPHIIALTVNSPFENKKATNDVWVDEQGRTRAPKCVRSIRLVKNTTQLGPTNEFEFIPYLKKIDVDGFARHVNRSYARMVDMYPYTRLNTIELRVSDTQLSVPRRISVALLLQTIALKAKKMVETGQKIPDVGAASLASNREAAVEAGLWGPFKPAVGDPTSEFIQAYNHQITEDPSKKKRNRFLGDAVASMLYILRDELEELDVIDNPFMQPTFVSIFGSEFVSPKTTGADFQLDVYAKSELNLVVLLRKLSEITRECCTNWLYDPLEGAPQMPIWLCWWKGIEPEIITDKERVFAGQKAHFSISLKNALPRDVEDVTLAYTIEDSERHIIEKNIIPIPRIEAGEIHIRHFEFDTQKGVPAYNILASIGITGREIKLSSTIQTFWTKANIRPATTTIFADGSTQIPFSGDIETSYPESAFLAAKVSVVSPSREKILAEVEQPLSVDAGGQIAFKNTDFPPLVVPDDFSEGVERCSLKISLTDSDGDEVMVSTSRPFYIGFVRKGPKLKLVADLKDTYRPGQTITGELELKTRGQALPKDAEVSLFFQADSARRHSITTIPVKDLVEKSASFEWKVPPIPSENTAERTGLLKAVLTSGTETISSTQTGRFILEHVGIKISIDSLRVPKNSEIGEKISGWLRIRRNTEEGEQASLEIVFIYPDGTEYPAFSQPIKQSRNLSIAFGPVEIPDHKIESTTETKRKTKPKTTAKAKTKKKAVPKTKPDSVQVEARISYGGEVIDKRVETIRLDGVEEQHLVRLTFSGVPGYATPDKTLHSTLHVANLSSDDMPCMLVTEIETVKGAIPIWEKEVTLKGKETGIYAVSVDIPLTAEMSTAYLTAKATTTGGSTRSSKRFKIKAVEEPHFHFRFMIKDSEGVEVPGLVPRVTPIKLILTGTATTAALDDVKFLLRVMSRRKVVKLFEIKIASMKRKDDGELEMEIPWTTPPVDVVSGYYLEALVEQGGLILPDRAVEQNRKQFTVY